MFIIVTGLSIVINLIPVASLTGNARRFGPRGASWPFCVTQQIRLLLAAATVGVLFMVVIHTFNWSTFHVLWRSSYKDSLGKLPSNPLRRALMHCYAALLVVIILVTVLAVVTNLVSPITDVTRRRHDAHVDTPFVMLRRCCRCRPHKDQRKPRENYGCGARPVLKLVRGMVRSVRDFFLSN